VVCPDKVRVEDPAGGNECPAASSASPSETPYG
jgi:hypothetical protein